MRQQIHLLGVLGALTCGAVAACNRAPVESFLPLSGTYVLQRANHAPLPLLLSSSAYGRYELLAETLLFEPGGKVLRERSIRRTHSSVGRDTTYTHRNQQEYRLRGQRLEIGAFQPCPPNANCVGNDVGTVTGPQIEVLTGLYRTGTEPPYLLYLRQ